MRIGDFSFVIMLDATAVGGWQDSPALQIMAGMARYYP
jgi:hypothetical protein